MLNFNPKKFKPSIGNISRIKAHEAYTNITKKKDKQINEAIADGFDPDAPTWEFRNVKNFQKGKVKKDIKVEKYFDINRDDKPFEKKKETPKYKAQRSFYMKNGVKHFHED